MNIRIIRQFRQRSSVLVQAATMVGVALCAWVPGAPAVAAAVSQAASNVKLPAVRLAGKIQGAQALRHLGAEQLATIAGRHRLSTEQLAQLLRDDSSAWLDEDGFLFFVDPAPVRGPARSPLDDTPSASALPDLSQTFLLHSRPGSNRVIYLDFDGQVVVGTRWNGTTGRAVIDASPFDLDGDQSSFSDREKATIQQVWQSVAEDFAPYDVDVTTQDPGPDGIVRTSLSDQNYGSRVLITRSGDAGICATPCGGVAVLSAFGRIEDPHPLGYVQPAWVFYDVLVDEDGKYVAEAISHEAGHHFGLRHDGAPGFTYYPGHGFLPGEGRSGWAPIMGVGYSARVTQWSRGEYPGANNTEDDLDSIGYSVPLRAADHGNGSATATALAGSRSGTLMSVEQSGVISKRADIDYFRLDMSAGSLSLWAVPAAVSPNLDILLSVYDMAGDLVAISVDPATGREVLDARISANLPAGRYFVAVDGVGDIDPSPGYSDYASLGQYSISGSYPAGSSGIPPTAVVSATPTSGTAPLTVHFDGGDSTDADGSITTYTWAFGDGASSHQIDPSHTYSVAGTYIARLTVTDNSGLQDPATIPITVSAAGNAMFVSKIGLSVNRSSAGYQCTAKVTVKNSADKLVTGATVTGRWSGVNSRTTSKATDKKGVASLTNARTKKKGTCTFSVTGVSKSGSTYVPARNMETSDSLSY